jgi:hypothetical protein
MFYRPRPWLIGLGVTLATWGALAVWAVVASVRRAQRGSRSNYETPA